MNDFSNSPKYAAGISEFNMIECPLYKLLKKFNNVLIIDIANPHCKSKTTEDYSRK